MRAKVAARGCRGILQMGKLFRIIDDDGSRSLQFSEFLKVCKELRLNFNEK